MQEHKLLFCLMSLKIILVKSKAHWVNNSICPIAEYKLLYGTTRSSVSGCRRATWFLSSPARVIKPFLTKPRECHLTYSVHSCWCAGDSLPGHHLCWGNAPMIVGFPSQRVSDAGSYDVIMSWLWGIDVTQSIASGDAVIRHRLNSIFVSMVDSFNCSNPDDAYTWYMRL